MNIILVWAVFLVPLGPEFSRVQDHFSWTAVKWCVFENVVKIFLFLACWALDTHPWCLDLQ